MSDNVYASIPEPQGTIESLQETARALKISVETLAGQRAGGPAMRVFHVATEPTSPRAGDVWINSADSGQTYIWNGNYWVNVSNSRFSALETTVAANTTSINSFLSGGFEEAVNITQGIASNLSSAFNAAMVELRAGIDIISLDAADLRNDLASAAIQATAYTDGLRSDFNSAVTTLTSSDASIRADVAAANASITSANTALTNAVNAARAEAADANAIMQTALAQANVDIGNALTELSSIATTITSIQSNVAGNTASITSEVAARATADSSLSGRIDSITVTAAGLSAQINTEAVTRANSDGSLAAQITTVNSRAQAQRVFVQSGIPTAFGRIVGDLWYNTADNMRPYYWDGNAWTQNTDGRLNVISASIDQANTTRASGDNALASQITNLNATVNGNVAAINTEAAVRATADGALGTRIDNLVVLSASGAAASVDSEATARISADTAIASRIDTLTATVDGNTAAITTEQTTRADGDSALSNLITSVSAQSTAVRVFNQPTAPTTLGRIAGDLWFDSDDGYRPYYWSGSAWLDNSNTRFTTIAANVTNETSARIANDTAISNSLNTLTSTVNGNIAAISNEASTRASADSAISQTVSNLTSTVQGNTASINSEAITRANADSALSSQITTLNSQTATTAANLTTEINTRATADTAITNSITSLTSTVNTNTSSISTEAVTRATADTALSGRIDSLTSTVNGNTASITSEAITRAAADTALSGRIDTLTSTVDGNTASITTEALTRANADTALSATITTVSAQASARRVFSQINAPTATDRIIGDLWFDSNAGQKPYYWNGTAWADNSDGRYTTIAASVTSETNARTNADSALGARIDSVVATASGNAAAITTEAIARANADSALSGRIDTLTSTVDGNTASITSEAATRATADTALSSQISTVSAQASAVRVFNQPTAPTSAGRLLGDLWFDSSNGFKPFYWNGTAWVDNSDNRFTTIAASVTHETNARISANSAITLDLSNLTSTVGGNTSAISTEQSTRANADSALSGRIDTLSSQTINPSNNQSLISLISNEAITRSNADSALSGRVDNVSAQAYAQRIFNQGSAPPTAGRILGDLWFNTSDGGRNYYFNGTAWVDNSDSRFTALAGSITNETNARIDAVNQRALASDVTTLTSTVNGHTASIQTLSSTSASVNGALTAQWGILGTINGVTGGLVLTGVRPANQSTGASYRLDILANARIEGSLIVTNSITADKIQANDLSSIRASLGTITAGKMQSSDSKFIVDLDARTITISD